MPSFLNKVFGYKKHDDKEPARPPRDTSDGALLDGKYEAVSPIVSPSAATFAEAQSPNRDVAFSFFRPKARASFQKAAQKRSEAAAPHLTLQLPGPKGDSRALAAVFEADPVSQAVLDDAAIAVKRLSPLEALALVRACSQAITERGLETPGIMHPHWFSASPDAQRKLISLFIRSLTPQRQTTPLSPTSPSPASAFANELHYARSPHDVAAVLRWSLRHLTLQDGHFGKDGAEWAWYNSFFQAERNASYPPKAFSELLLPQLPAPHVELLTVTLTLISALASHAEANSISGSKLSKFWGIWLLLATRAQGSDDWNQFYARWERAGRILEHLFLARLREESFDQRLPTRLQELVKYYPYNKGSTATDDLLPRPRFSTRQYDALFVRIETLLLHGAEQPKQHPVQLLLEAFQIPIESPSESEHLSFWNTLKTAAFDEATPSGSEGLQFNRIFVDETIQLLSLVPSNDSSPPSPALLTSPIPKVMSRDSSSSLAKTVERVLPHSNSFYGSPPASPTSPTSPVIADWAQFSLSGFGDAPTTQPLAVPLVEDDDIEVTQPRLSPKSSRQRGKPRARRRRSEDNEPSDAPASQPKSESSVVETKLGAVHVVQVDEAFIDFWSDAIVDPISANWPTFVVCGLKQLRSTEQSIRWLVIEQIYNRQEPQPPRIPSPDGPRGRSPRPSFRSDISGLRINSVFSSARKRFSVFSKSTTDLDPKKSGGKNPVAGELGEALVEEEPTPRAATPTQADHRVAAAAITATTAVIAEQLKAEEISPAPIRATAPPVNSIPKAEAEAPSVEPTPESGGRANGSPEVPRCLVPEAVVSVEQTLDAFTSKGAVLAPGPVLTAESHATGIPAEQNDVVARPVEMTGGPVVADDLREVAEVVAKSPALATVVPPAAIAAVDDEAPQPTTEEPRVPEELSGKASADLVAATIVRSDEIIATETSARPEPDPITSMADGVEEAEIAEVAEIPTPAPEPATLVEETPGPEVSVAVCPAESVVQDTAPVSGPQSILNAEETPVAQLPAVDRDVQAVTVGAELTTIQVPDLEPQRTIVQVADPDISISIVSASQASENVTAIEAGAASIDFDDCILESQVPTPVTECAVSIDETPSSEIAADVEETVEASPTVADSGAAQVSAPEHEVGAIVEEANLPTPSADVQPVDALSTASVAEAATAASTTVDRIITLTAEVQPAPDVPAEDADAQAREPIDEPVAIDEPAELTSITATDAKPLENKAAEAVTEEAHVLVERAASPLDESIATRVDTLIIEDAQPPTAFDVPSSESVPQFVVEATNHPTDVGFTPEELVEAEAQLESEAVLLVVDTEDEAQAVVEEAESAPLDSGVHVTVEDTADVVDANEPVVLVPELAPVVGDVVAPVEEEDVAVAVEEIESGQPDAAPIVVDEAGEIDEPQDVVDLPPEQPPAFEVDEPAGPSESVEA